MISRFLTCFNSTWASLSGYFAIVFARRHHLFRRNSVSRLLCDLRTQLSNRVSWIAWTWCRTIGRNHASAFLDWMVWLRARHKNHCGVKWDIPLMYSTSKKLSENGFSMFVVYFSWRVGLAVDTRNFSTTLKGRSHLMIMSLFHPISKSNVRERIALNHTTPLESRNQLISQGSEFRSIDSSILNHADVRWTCFFFQSRCFGIPLNDAQVLLKHMRKREIIKSPVPLNDGDVSPPSNKNH